MKLGKSIQISSQDILLTLISALPIYLRGYGPRIDTPNIYFDINMGMLTLFDDL